MAYDGMADEPLYPVPQLRRPSLKNRELTMSQVPHTAAQPRGTTRIAFDNTGEKLIVMWALVGGGSDLYLLDVPDLAVARCVHVARPNQLGTLPAPQGSFGVGGKWLSYRSRLVAPLSNPFPRTW